MIQRAVILGGGTAGTLTANRLQREIGGQAAITVVDRDDDHWYQPGLLFVPFGRARPGKLVRPHKMGQLDIPSVPEFIEMIADTGAGLYACQASLDLFGLTRDDFIEQVKDIITVGEFYDLAAGGQIIFT